MILKISAMHFDLNNNSARQRLEALIQAIEAPDDSVNTCNQLAQRLNQLKQKDIPFTFISSRSTRNYSTGRTKKFSDRNKTLSRLRPGQPATTMEKAEKPPNR